MGPIMISFQFLVVDGPWGLLFIASRSNRLPWNQEDIVHIELSVIIFDSTKYTLSIRLDKDARHDCPCIQIVVDYWVGRSMT
jgi:hypothetical protein